MLKSGPEPRPHARRAGGRALAARTQYSALELFFGPIWLWVGVAPSGGGRGQNFLNFRAPQGPNESAEGGGGPRPHFRPGHLPAQIPYKVS